MINEFFNKIDRKFFKHKLISDQIEPVRILSEIILRKTLIKIQEDHHEEKKSNRNSHVILAFVKASSIDKKG